MFAAVPPYSGDVLEMAGFVKLIRIHETRWTPGGSTRGTRTTREGSGWKATSPPWRAPSIPRTWSGCTASTPRNRGSQERYLHPHGVVFRNIPGDLDRRVQRIVPEGEFVDLRHHPDTTTRRRAKVGVASIPDIEVV